MANKARRGTKAWAKEMMSFIRHSIIEHPHPMSIAMMKLWDSIDADDRINHKQYPVFVQRVSGRLARKVPYKVGSFFWLSWDGYHGITLDTQKSMELFGLTREGGKNWIKLAHEDVIGYAIAHQIFNP